MNSNNYNIFPDTIAAIATPAGVGGVGIIRISGIQALKIAQFMVGNIPKPRTAHYCNFKDPEGNILDKGICLYFPKPNSFTGEDIIELQGHGGPVVLDIILQNVIELGAKLANPGEFTERAFLNNKIDLVQAEAIADLIDAGSRQAAQSALRSLEGDFSRKIASLLDALIALRMFVEAAIDFPEEEIDFIGESKTKENLSNLIEQINELNRSASQGVLLQEGMNLVLVGKPNVGKSSLLNCLSKRETAIVTEIAGTTRDILREKIHIDGMPLHIIDTAGLRETQDVIEREGIRRTHQAILQADLILLIVDANESYHFEPEFFLKELLPDIPNNIPVLIVRNKIDLIGKKAQRTKQNDFDTIDLSIKNNDGIELLLNYLKGKAGYENHFEGVFIARRRHLTALEQTLEHLTLGKKQLEQHFASEILAEELIMAQQSLNQITGEFSSDDLLGKIFSNFCIGK